MRFLTVYANLIRAAVLIPTAIQLFKRDYKKLMPAVATLVATFAPWILGLIDFHLNPIAEFLLPTVVFMGIYLGTAYRYYDRFSWWDRVVHFLAGIMLFSVGIALFQKLSNVGLAAMLVFSVSFSLALHVIWEVLEFLSDTFFRTDHQHWQKHSKVVNHQPEKAMQPPGLVDTMSDCIVNIIGSLIACAGWWIYFAIQ